MKRIFILTGAGVSAESGIPTFRGGDGLWEGHRVEDVATPEGFERNPELVHAFYNGRRRRLSSVEPNPAHLAIARLQRDRDVTLVTQNVDDLHERAGSAHVIHMHGELLKARCERCGTVADWSGDMDASSACGHCQKSGGMRPHIVWFGEMPLEMEAIEAAIVSAGLFVAIGTSGNVYPAAGFAAIAAEHGIRTLEINPAATGISGVFDEHRRGPAGMVVPAWVDEIIGENPPLKVSPSRSAAR